MSNGYETKPPRVGLWRNDRGPMASGNCGGIRFVLWENTRKDNDRSPDFYLVLEAAQRRDSAPQGGYDPNKPGHGSSNQPPASGAPAGGGGLPDDSIPFAPEWR